MTAMILRLLELLLTGVMLIIFAPIMLVIALFIVIESGLPVFYMSPRIGRNGTQFGLFYFRTMTAGTGTSDERLTRTGRFLRSYSLDHIPQLFNLLRGDIHFLGPRPMTPDEVDMTNEDYQQVLNVKPGVLSPSIVQLGKTYNATDFVTKVKLEHDYLKQRSVGSEIRFFFDMFGAVIKSQGNVKARGKPRITPSNPDNPDE